MTTILSMCSGDYGEAFKELIPSWVNNAEADNVIIYSDKNYDVPGVEIRPNLFTPQNWVDAVGMKADVIQGFLKEWNGDRLLFTDMDCYIRQPFEEIWDEDFDISVSERASDSADSIACGTFFAKNTESFRRFVDEWVYWQKKYKERGVGIKPHRQAYDQYSFTDLLDKDWLKVHYYDGKVYNNRRMLYGGISSWQEDCLNAKIIHFAGDYWRNKHGKPVLENLREEKASKPATDAPQFRLLTWWWKQEKSNFTYTVQDVNRLYRQAKQHITIPFDFACVTDETEGFHPDIKLIPLPHELDYLSSDTWQASKGKPQCYRRLALWAPDADERFGHRRLFSIDLDVNILSNVDHIFSRKEDVVLLKSEDNEPNRPYNGSLLGLTVGSRPHVWEKLSVDTVRKASSLFRGSDQAVLSHLLGDQEATWGKQDGICMSTPGAYKKKKWDGGNCKMVFWLGIGDKPMSEIEQRVVSKSPPTIYVPKHGVLNVMTWLWRQDKGQNVYTYADVNRWAEECRYNLTIPHTLSCVTDTPEGIDKGVNIIPMPQDFINVSSTRWSASRGKPQCHRRLAMFHKDAGKIYGQRFVSMDLDCNVFGNLDSVFGRDVDFIITQSTSEKRPYNGSMLMMTAGARPQVYDKLTQERIEHASKTLIGSDQAFLGCVLGWYEETWKETDGVYLLSSRQAKSWTPPENCLIAFYPGGRHEKPMSRFANPVVKDNTVDYALVFDNTNWELGKKVHELLSDKISVKLIRRPSNLNDIPFASFGALYFYDHNWIRPYYKNAKLVAGAREGSINAGKVALCNAVHCNNASSKQRLAELGMEATVVSDFEAQEIADFAGNKIREVA